MKRPCNRVDFSSLPLHKPLPPPHLLDARVVEHLDLPEVIGGGDQTAGVGAIDGVDVGAVGLLGPNALDGPAQRARPRRPLCVTQRGRGSDLIARRRVVEQQLVRAAVGLDRAAVLGEVDVGDVRTVRRAPTTQRKSDNNKTARSTHGMNTPCHDSDGKNPTHHRKLQHTKNNSTGARLVTRP